MQFFLFSGTFSSAFTQKGMNLNVFIKVTQKFKLKTKLYSSQYVWAFACISVYHVCKMVEEARKGHQISLELELHMVASSHMCARN